MLLHPAGLKDRATSGLPSQSNRIKPIGDTRPQCITQIYHILLPICNMLSQLPVQYKSPTLHAYIDAKYGSLNTLYLKILGNFFQHAFNSSGMDNFYDVGSCINECLTSMWNWCMSLEKKHYFHVHTILFLELLRIQESAG